MKIRDVMSKDVQVARPGDTIQEVAARMAAAYGSQMTKLLDGATSAADLGEDFGAGLSAREVDWLVTHEWARSAEDILWRRSRLGLDVSAADVARLEIYLAAHPAAQTGEPRTH